MRYRTTWRCVCRRSVAQLATCSLLHCRYASQHLWIVHRCIQYRRQAAADWQEISRRRRRRRWMRATFGHLLYRGLSPILVTRMNAGVASARLYGWRSYSRYIRRRAYRCFFGNHWSTPPTTKYQDASAFDRKKCLHIRVSAWCPKRKAVHEIQPNLHNYVQHISYRITVMKALYPY